MCRLDKKEKKKTIYPKNEDDKCFQYALNGSLNYVEIESHAERDSNKKPFINKYNWKGKNYPSKIDDCKKFEKSNSTIALNILFNKEKNIYSLYLKT